MNVRFTIPLFGDVYVNDCDLRFGRGYGLYILSIYFSFEGRPYVAKVNVHDAGLWDDYCDNDKSADWLVCEARYTIERGVEEFLNKL